MMCFRYYLYNLAFQHWQMFMNMQKEKKSKVQQAVQFGKRLRQTMIARLQVHSYFSMLDKKHNFCDIMHHVFYPSSWESDAFSMEQMGSFTRAADEEENA